MPKTTPESGSRNDAALMVKTYKDRAKAYQVDDKNFIVAYYTGPVLVNLLVDIDELEVVIHRLRNKNKLIVDFDWMADR